MSGLKSAWELSLEKSNELVPELKDKKKLTGKQKKEINEIRAEYKAKVADLDVTLQHKRNQLSGGIPGEEMSGAVEELKKTFVEEKKALEEEMERKIEAVRSRTR
ncbi:MAG: hypothetical protein GWM98_19390 [Nitrospinaceae bacterium]|nr:hypothetical protein [Nitrospinaceae bacterium]NIR56251.1 hypothetical protein [Nitrospinaceae bacterium]NIS86707.1 hypothetical protein [Nitrospinaceae bacterium]NIT83540.1 hypothetical protein [Nitrospinaceae bacterium]NIU45745.1 hypothetical protein [Nitrospinaceae bacterium]